MRILLVEDDETALEVFREALTEYEYEVVTARNGEDALQKARLQSFDLVVTDIRMPGTDGLQALEEVKAMHPETKSIVVTGYASEAETLKAMQIGVGEYLKKPFRLSELLQAVKRQLERTRVDERERQRERALRATLMWALKMFLAECRLTRASWVQESGKWAITLGRQLGLPEEEVESLSLATILLALAKTSPDALPPFVSGSLPDSVKALLELGVEANVNPEARQVMEAAQRLAQSSVAPEQARSSEASDDYASRRGMLHVALSLEAAGDWDNASAALAELSQSGVNREAVLAALGAARVAWKSGKADAARDLARQAYTLARSVGPLAQAEVVVEAGILLALVKVEEAKALLAEGKLICEGLGLSNRISLAQLAEALFFEGDSLGSSLREAHVALTPRELVEHSYWLLPALVHSAAARACNEIYPLLTALVSSSPGRAQRFLRDPKVQGLLTELCQRSSDPEFMKAMGYQDSATETASELASLPSGHSLRIFGLGKMDFFVDGRALAEPVWKRNQKAKLLLFRLCLDPSRSFTDEVLIEELWPGQDHASKANLNALRATLRSALRGGEAGDGFEYIVREGKGTRIHPECKVVLDARELTEAVQRARQSKGEPFERMHLTKVVELYTGPFLESCYLEWAVTTRNTLEQSVLESLSRLCQLAEEGQNHDQVLECSTRILQLDRCNQEAYRLGMQAFINSGRPEQAVRLFERCARILKTELEMEPSIELLSLYHRAKLSL